MSNCFLLIGRIMPNESLFTYIFGQSPSTFDNRTFIPVFDISDLPFNVTGVVQQTCGDNLECLFDVGATGRIEVGQATRNTQITYNETIMLSQPGRVIEIRNNFLLSCFSSYL